MILLFFFFFNQTIVILVVINLFLDSVPLTRSLWEEEITNSEPFDQVT